MGEKTLIINISFLISTSGKMVSLFTTSLLFYKLSFVFYKPNLPKRTYLCSGNENTMIFQP